MTAGATDVFRESDDDEDDDDDELDRLCEAYDDRVVESLEKDLSVCVRVSWGSDGPRSAEWLTLSLEADELLPKGLPKPRTMVMSRGGGGGARVEEPDFIVYISGVRVSVCVELLGR